MIAFALHQKYLGAGGEGFLPMLANGSANADAAFPTLVAKLLPAGVKGLVVCGILAALMSSLHLCSTHLPCCLQLTSTNASNRKLLKRNW